MPGDRPHIASAQVLTDGSMRLRDVLKKTRILLKRIV